VENAQAGQPFLHVIKLGKPPRLHGEQLSVSPAPEIQRRSTCNMIIAAGILTQYIEAPNWQSPPLPPSEVVDGYFIQNGAKRSRNARFPAVLGIDMSGDYRDLQMVQCWEFALFRRKGGSSAILCRPK